MPIERKEALRANVVTQRAGFADVFNALCAAAAADAAPGLPPWLKESAATRSNMLSVVIKDRQHERELSGVGIPVHIHDVSPCTCLSYPVPELQAQDENEILSLNTIFMFPFPFLMLVHRQE